MPNLTFDLSRVWISPTDGRSGMLKASTVKINDDSKASGCILANSQYVIRKGRYSDNEVKFLDTSSLNAPLVLCRQCRSRRMKVKCVHTYAGSREMVIAPSPALDVVYAA